MVMIFLLEKKFVLCQIDPYTKSLFEWIPLHMISYTPFSLPTVSVTNNQRLNASQKSNTDRITPTTMTRPPDTDMNWLNDWVKCNWKCNQNSQKLYHYLLYVPKSFIHSFIYIMHAHDLWCQLFFPIVVVSTKVYLFFQTIVWIKMHTLTRSKKTASWMACLRFCNMICTYPIEVKPGHLLDHDMNLQFPRFHANWTISMLLQEHSCLSSIFC